MYFLVSTAGVFTSMISSAIIKAIGGLNMEMMLAENIRMYDITTSRLDFSVWKRMKNLAR